MGALANPVPMILRMTKSEVATAIELRNQGKTLAAVSLELNVPVSTITNSIQKAKIYGFRAWEIRR